MRVKWSKESPFTFDVWVCPNCQFVISHEEYTRRRQDYTCAGCRSRKWSQFEYVPAKKPDTEPTTML